MISHRAHVNYSAQRGELTTNGLVGLRTTVCDLDDPQEVLYSGAEPGEMDCWTCDTLSPPASLHSRKILRLELVAVSYTHLTLPTKA